MTMIRSLRFATTSETPSQPISAINTTPLIDLMLVLLIMFIISIPIATHKVPLDLPTPGPIVSDPAPSHRLSLDAAGRFDWDGRAIADPQLAPLLARLAADPVGPELQLLVDAETRYHRVDETLAAIRRAGVVRLGFVGNERFAAAIDG
jgi:biopolymer transport protein ExbD